MLLKVLRVLSCYNYPIELYFLLSFIRFRIMITTELINEILFPIVLFFIYMTILMYLFYEFPENYVPHSKKKVHQMKVHQMKVHQIDRDRIPITHTTHTPKMDKTDPESIEIDRFLGSELAGDPQRLKLRLTSLKFIDSLEHLSIYEIYRLSIVLGLTFKFDSNEYKPLEDLRGEIKDIFDRDRCTVLSAISQIKENSYQ